MSTMTTVHPQAVRSKTTSSTEQTDTQSDKELLRLNNNQCMDTKAHLHIINLNLPFQLVNRL